MPAATADVTPPRRSTRGLSLARFRYREGDDEDEPVKKEESDEDVSSLSELSFGSDMEDAIVGPRRRGGAARQAKRGSTQSKARTSTPPVTGKRKRAAAALPERRKKTDVKKEDDDDDAEPVAEKNPTAPRRVRKPARVVTEGEGNKVEPPSDWEEMYALVKAMRLGDGPAAHAAVDTMGCERLAQADASPRDRRFHTLVALMLSSQTKDTVNAVAMARLQTELPPYRPGAPAGLNLENLLAVEPARLNELIWQVGFHNNKTKYLQQAAAILRDQWGGDIPSTAEGLMALPGVGPKMAYLCLAAEHGWNRVEGIGVDVHVHRITNLWGWQAPKTTTPEATRLALQSWLPHDRWKEINWLLVGFGQKVCLPQGSKCGDCTLGLRGLCRAADRKKVAEGRRRQQLKEEEEEQKNGAVIKKEEDD